MERNIFLKLRFDGTDFHGWQIQDNAVTVQQCLSESVCRILGEKIKINGCSRTDSGVHANMFCCNFHTSSDRSNERIIEGLNAVLPGSIGVYECKDVENDFHARFSCKGKEYIYKIWNSKYKNPFLNGYALPYQYNADSFLMNEQAKAFIGTHDFSAFCASGSSVIDNRRTIYDCSVKEQDKLIIFSVTGDGFLYNMVRIMVGTLLDISSGKIEKNSIERIIQSKDRNNSGITAKACGLYLNKVFYREAEIEEYGRK